MIATSGALRYQPNKKYATWDDWWVQTPLRPAKSVVLYDRDGVWRARLDVDGKLYIRAGFPWDGASGPTRDVLKLPFTRPQNSMRGSVTHDALYWMERAVLIPYGWREQCDELLVDLCVQDGMWRWRARLWLWGVRKFAASSAKPQPEEVLVAP